MATNGTKTGSEASEEIRFRNPARQVGFAQLYHVATLDPEISDGALRTFLLYLKYAQQSAACWPSRDTLAKKRGVDPATLSRHNRELVEAGYISRKRRVNAPSLTYIEDYEQVPRLKAIAEAEIAERCKNATFERGENAPTDVAKMQPQMLQKCNVEEESVEEEPIEEEEELRAPTGAENSDGPDSGDSSDSSPETPEAVTETTETAAAGNDAPPAAEDDRDATPSPGQARLAALRAKYGGDYLDVAATCAAAQEQAGPLAGFTTPAQAGGADPFADGPLAAFCDLVGARIDLLSESEQRSWPRRLRELAEAHGLDDAEMAACIALLPQSDWAWRVKSFTSPYAGGFDEVIAALIRRRLAGRPVLSGDDGGRGNGRRPAASRREYEPCSGELRAAAWAAHGRWLTNFVAQQAAKLGISGEHLAVDLYHEEIAGALGLSREQTQALCEEYTARRSLALEPVDVEALLGRGG